MKILCYENLRERGIPYSADHIRRLEKSGQFPRSFSLGGGRKAWDEADIDAWLKSRKAAAASPAAA